MRNIFLIDKSGLGGSDLLILQIIRLYAQAGHDASLIYIEHSTMIDWILADQVDLNLLGAPKLIVI